MEGLEEGDGEEGVGFEVDGDCGKGSGESRLKGGTCASIEDEGIDLSYFIRSEELEERSGVGFEGREGEGGDEELASCSRNDGFQLRSIGIERADRGDHSGVCALQ